MSENHATEEEAQKIAAEQAAKEAAEKAAQEPTEAEKRIKELEDEKAAVLVREANYKAAYLKEKRKNETTGEIEETPEELARRVTREELANAQIGRIDAERETVYQQTLKENRELKLAQMNKTTVATAPGSHTESRPVSDTLVTPEQIEAFKRMNWSDKDIERYKKNLQKNSR